MQQSPPSRNKMAIYRVHECSMKKDEHSIIALHEKLGNQVLYPSESVLNIHVRKAYLTKLVIQSQAQGKTLTSTSIVHRSRSLQLHTLDPA